MGCASVASPRYNDRVQTSGTLHSNLSIKNLFRSLKKRTFCKAVQRKRTIGTSHRLKGAGRLGYARLALVETLDSKLTDKVVAGDVVMALASLQSTCA